MSKGFAFLIAFAVFLGLNLLYEYIHLGDPWLWEVNWDSLSSLVKSISFLIAIEVWARLNRESSERRSVIIFSSFKDTLLTLVALLLLLLAVNWPLDNLVYRICLSLITAGFCFTALYLFGSEEVRKELRFFRKDG